MLLKILFSLTILLFSVVLASCSKQTNNLNREFTLTNSRANLAPENVDEDHLGNNWLQYVDEPDQCPHSLHGPDGILYSGFKKKSDKFWRHRLPQLLDGPHIMANKVNGEINVLVRHPELIQSRKTSHRSPSCRRQSKHSRH